MYEVSTAAKVRLHLQAMAEPSPVAPSLRPRVSVLMPVFNTVRYLDEALCSISNQSFADFELVVVDDGSTDGSRALLESHLAIEPRMRLISRGNRGLVRTRNELLDAARGELAAWMDSDDISLPDRLARQVQSFDEDRRLVCVSGSVECIDEDGVAIYVETYPQEHEEIVKLHADGGGLRFGASMMNTALARAVGGFREPFVYGEDFDLLLRLSEQGRMANFPDVLLRYRHHASSTTSRLGSSWPAYRDVILQLAHERRTEGSDRLQRGETVVVDTTRFAEESAARRHARMARRAMLNGRSVAALKHAWEAIRADPVDSIGWRLLVRVCVGSVFRG